MKIKLSAHGAYHHQYHVVWIPKYRKKVLKGELKQYLEKGLFDIETRVVETVSTYTVERVVKDLAELQVALWYRHRWARGTVKHRTP